MTGAGGSTFSSCSWVTLDSGAIGVEDPLQQGLRIGLDLAAPFRQRLGDRGLADHFAHGALGGGFDRRLGSRMLKR